MKIKTSQLFNFEIFWVSNQLIFSAVITFFHATGKYFPFSVILFFNSGFYLMLYGNRIKNIMKSPIGVVFCGFFIVISLSFVNYFFYRDIQGFMFHDANHFQIYTSSIVWFLNFLVFYMFSVGGKSLKVVSIFTWVFFVVAIYANIKAYNHFRLFLNTEIQHHYYYYLIMIIPLLIWVTQNKKVKYIFICMALVGTIFSFKRTGILVCGVLIFVNIFFDLKNRSIKQKATFVFFLLILALSLSYLLPEMSKELTHMVLRLSRIQEDGGSGRLDHAYIAIYNFSNLPFENQLIGNGFWSMYLQYGHFIDIEWVSIVYYYGLMGLGLYLMFHILAVIRLIKISKINHLYFISFLNCYVIFFLYSLASELFTYLYLSVPLFIYMGVIEGTIIKDSNKINVK